MLLIEFSFWGGALPGHVGRSTKRFVSVRARYNNMERVNSVGAVGDINIFDEKFKASVGLGGL